MMPKSGYRFSDGIMVCLIDFAASVPRQASSLGCNTLKAVVIFRIRSLRFKSLFFPMSLSRNRFPLSGDML
jgi:hypothetical protein